MSDQLNPDEGQLRACCAADAWVTQMAARRPFASVDAAFALSDNAVRALDDTGLEQALGAHARIGERRSGDGVEDRWSRREQAGPLVANGPRVHEFIAEMHREVFAGRADKLITVGETPGATVADGERYTDPARHELDMAVVLEVGVAGTTRPVAELIAFVGCKVPFRVYR